ncbi:MAG: ABC transporter permease [Desulfobacula sp.]|nr:ABC transporter permease [Desulfobacula sp.]
MVRRFLLGIVTLWVASILVFAGTEILPGDVASAILGQSATPETIAAIRQQLRLDRPAPVRYVVWLSHIVRGELGNSLTTGRAVSGIISDSLKNTVVLAALTAFFAVPLSLGLGLLSAAYPDSLLDRGISISSLVGISLPEFFTGTLLVLVFAVTFHLLPAVSVVSEFSSFMHKFRALVLPILTLTLAVLAHMTRMTRAAILDTLGSHYVEMAILKGVPRSRIILRHALPNALGPIINVIAINIGFLASGVVVVESVFAYPGLGRLIIDAVSFRDIPLVQGTAMIFCVFYIGVNLLADLLVLTTNPRLWDKK